MPARITLFQIYGGNMDFSFLKKFKNLEIKKSYVIAVIFIALVIRFWGVNSVTLLQKEIPIVDTKEISVEEINHYIQTKPQYLEDNINVDVSIIVSRDLEAYLDKKTHEWFLLRGWHPKRFFYVEERLKLIVSLINDRKAKLYEAQKLEKQADLQAENVLNGNYGGGLTTAELRKRAQDIRYYINREIRYAGITEEEDGEVMRHFQTIESLLER